MRWTQQFIVDEHQNARTMEASSADLVRLKCPCPTAKSYSQRMEALVKPRLTFCLGRPDTLLQPTRGCISGMMSIGTLEGISSRDLGHRYLAEPRPKRPGRQQNMMSLVKDNPVQLVTFGVWDMFIPQYLEDMSIIIIRTLGWRRPVVPIS